MAKVVAALEMGDIDDENLVEDNARMESAVDADIKEFDEYFQKCLGNDPLTRGETAIIKTFLYYHLVYKRQQPSDATG